MCFRSNSLLSAVMVMVGVFGVTAVAQTQSDVQHLAALSRQYVQLSRSGRIDEAGQAAERYAAFLQQRFPKRDQYRGSMYLAEARNNQGRYQESMELWQQTIERLKDFHPQTEAERKLAILVQGDSLRSIGFCLERMGRAKEAVPYYEATVAWWARANVSDARLHWAGAQVGLGDVHRLLSDFDKAARLLTEAVVVLEPLARGTPANSPASHYLCAALGALGVIDHEQGRFDLAEPKLRRALKMRVAENGWQHLDTAHMLDAFVRLYGEQARWREAEQYCRAQLEIYEISAGKDHPETTNAVILLAQVLNHQNRYAEAESLFRKALARLESQFGSENPRTGSAVHQLGKVLWYQDKYDEAESLLNRSLAIAEKAFGPTTIQVADELSLLAELNLSQGDAAESLRILDRLAGIHQLHPLAPQGLENMHRIRASALWNSGQQEAAIAELDKSLAQVEFQSGYSSGAERERAEMFEGLSASFEVAISWQAELKDVSKLFLAIERAKARSFMDELRLKNVDLLAGKSAAKRQQLTQQENDLRQQLTGAEQRFEALPDPGPNPSAESVAQRKKLVSEILQARDALYQHLAEVRSASPIYRELLTNRTRLASLPQMQQLLGDDELLLAYSVGQTVSYVISVRRNGAEFSPLTVDDKAAAALGVTAGPLTADKLNKLLQDETTGVLSIISAPKRHDEDVSGTLAALWQLLIPESDRAGLTEGKVKLLTIVPDGPLALLPFETLVVKNDSAPEYLLDVGPPIAYAPSAAVLLNLAKREKTNAAAQQQLLTLGDPAYPRAGASTQDAVDRQLGVTRTSDQFRAGLTRLPYTGWESTWLQQAFEKVGFKCEKHSGAQATEAAIRRDVPGRQIIHLACHGMADQNYGNFFGALAIAPGKAGESRDDGFLSMSEIYELDLTGCELAILSACETNYGPQQQGEGVWALSRGFLVAGSRRVIASNWVVDDQAGATLVSYFATYLTKTGAEASAGDDSTRDYAAALHTAKRNVRKVEKWRHPFYWSSLVLVGPK